MTVDNLREQVDSIISNKASILHLYLILKDDNEYCLRLADIGDTSTMADLSRMFIKNLYETIVENPEVEIRSLSADDKVERAIYRYDFEEYPNELKLFETFNISDAIRTAKFDFSEDDINKLFGFIVYIGTMDKGLSLFKKHYPIALIKRDSFLLGAVKSRQRFEKISGTDIIRMNNEWQLISIEGEIFVRDLSVLERNLGFRELIKKSANSAIELIKALDIVSDIGAISAEIANMSFARKLSVIQKSSVVLTKKIPGVRLVQFSQETPGLKGQFKYDEKNTKFVLSTKAEKMAFLRLLNDDFLQSQLTEEYYTANSKDRLKRKE